MIHDGSDMQRIVFTCNSLVCFAYVTWEKVNICALFDVRLQFIKWSFCVSCMISVKMFQIQIIDQLVLL